MISMRFQQLRDAHHPMYDTALALYRSSFPPHEQRQLPSQTAILRDDEYHFTLIYDESLFVGLVLYWEHNGFIYVEHFCILPELRNKGYGQQVLTMLGQQGKTVILEIDPPVDAISLRRKGFYQRCGFAENPYPHVHPPYHKDNHGHELVVLSAPATITRETYDVFNHYLTHRVMANAFSE